MGGGLASRLKRIQESRKALAAAEVRLEGGNPANEAGAERTAPTGWTRLRPLVLSRETEYEMDFPATIDARPFLLRRLDSALRRDRPGQADSEIGPRAAPSPEPGLRAISCDRLFFIDTETTGLSTGAGTVAFAFGAGWFSGGRFRIRQLFLEDYPGEPDFLELALGMVPEDGILVSFNGAAFDLGVLRTRCILSGMRFPEKGHIDLLRTARRLWSRPCGGASLSLLEDRVLGKPREGDLPGSEAPERFFRFLKTNDFACLEPVLDHHRLDIASLPFLMKTADAAFRRPLEARGIDGTRFGLCLAALDRPEWEEVLLRSHRLGTEGAAKALSLLYKRQKRWEEAIPLWEGMEQTSKTLHQLAIAYERGLHDYSEAIRICEKALELDLTENEKTTFMKRRERLHKRAGKKR